MAAAGMCWQKKKSSSWPIVGLTIVIGLFTIAAPVQALQSWIEQPKYTEVNPKGQVVLPCSILNKKGECSWEKDGSPVGLFPEKYQWAGSPETGDCSLRILDASLEYDDGVWQCQVTASSFKSQDVLVSEGSQLIVRESPANVVIQRSSGDSASEPITAKAGEDVELECIVTGGNPPATIRWFAKDQEILTGHRQENSRSASNSRVWVSISKLVLPVSKTDNGVAIRCMAEHPTLDMPMSARTSLVIQYPPTVRIETVAPEILEEGKDDATLKCVTDANPPAKVLWRKEGLNGIFSPDKDITFSPVSRHTAGLYSCTAENVLGMSKEDYVQLDVKYAPVILSVGPAKVVRAKINNKLTLTCEAEGNPQPRYQWLQRLPSTQEVRIRGNDKNLIIDDITYDHQGEFVCKAMNIIRGEERSTQSEPVKVQVTGAPRVVRYSVMDEVRVQNGEDATLEVLFCSDPQPKGAWHLSAVEGGVTNEDSSGPNNIILAAGTAHGRFVAESIRKADRDHCYISSLRINGAHADDSHSYQLRVSNSHGSDAHVIRLMVRDRVSQESLIAVVVGAVLTLLCLILILIYCCNKSKCCSSRNSGSKKDFKPSDIESERTEVESTHSSHHSGYPAAADKAAAIPPDALYATAIKETEGGDGLFNDSKESLRPDSRFSSNLNRTQSSSLELNPNQLQQLQYHHQHQRQQQQQPKVQYPVGPPRIVYNDLCFPKTSNYGSMKKKKNRDLVQQQQQQQQHLNPHLVGLGSSSTGDSSNRSSLSQSSPQGFNGLYP